MKKNYKIGDKVSSNNHPEIGKGEIICISHYINIATIKLDTPFNDNGKLCTKADLSIKELIDA